MERGWKFLTLYGVLKFRISPSLKDVILLKLPYLSNWRTIAITNEVLSETYHHPSGNYTPLGDYHGDGRLVTEGEKKLHEAELFLDFIRNGIAHRLQRQLMVSPEQHETVLNACYPLLLPHLQESIFDVLGPKEFAKHFHSRYTIKKRYNTALD
ncbi:hypothetical protein QOZ80_2AG0127140 [Eleusine coracana subsp. coracana]|nr:hypothetical protein QOZ80_2AG0127140 [Eleusine coracana subsp. coracana]